MRRLLIITIILTLVFSMAGCGSGDDEYYVIKNNKVYVVLFYPPSGMPLLDLIPPDLLGFLSTRHEKELPDIDVETFADLGYGYAKDKNHVYDAGRIILETKGDVYDDAGMIILDYKKVNADALTFEVLGEHYGRDKNQVYHMSGVGDFVVEGADIESFVSIGRHTGKDAYQVFRNAGTGYEEKFTPYDVASYEMLEYGEWRWGRDKAYYYFCDEKQDVDRVTFELLEKGYARDKNHVYYWDVSHDEWYHEPPIVEGADPATFTVLTGKDFHLGVGKDRNGYYVGVEPATKEEVDKLPNESFDFGMWLFRGVLSLPIY
jgi:hypothetical protein